jgi:hypothetical protein
MIALVVALAGLGPQAPARACNVPVFRYALEHWRPDAYEILLYHRGPLGDADKQAFTALADRIDAGGHNIKLSRIDLDDTLDERQQAIFDHQQQPQLPWLVVRYPEQLGINADVWSGQFNGETAELLLDSPVRRELTKRILAGETSVWLLLEGENAAENAAARQQLESSIHKLKQELKLPELTDDPEDEIATGGPPLKIAFSVLPISRTDPREALLRKMLIGSESDLAERRDPMVFPVFGRGRALFGLVGPGITEQNIADSATFLTGPCSCQVKEANPGFDLLLADRFDEVIGSALVTDMAALDQEGTEVPIPPGPKQVTPTAALAASSTMASVPTPGQAVPAPVVAEYSLVPRMTWARLLMFGGGGFLLLVLVLGSLAVLFSSRAKQGS